MLQGCRKNLECISHVPCFLGPAGCRHQWKGSEKTLHHKIPYMHAEVGQFMKTLPIDSTGRWQCVRWNLVIKDIASHSSNDDHTAVPNNCGDGKDFHVEGPRFSLHISRFPRILRSQDWEGFLPETLFISPLSIIADNTRLGGSMAWLSLRHPHMPSSQFRLLGHRRISCKALCI